MEIINRKARYDYFVLEEYEAGIVLTGTEIKSIREGKVNIGDSYAIIRNEEVYLLNTHISSYEKVIYLIMMKIELENCLCIRVKLKN